MEMAKVTSKGQITIPISIRKRLKISEGDKLLFIDRPDGIMMVNPDLLGGAQEVEINTNEETVAIDGSARPDVEDNVPHTSRQPIDEGGTVSGKPKETTKSSPGISRKSNTTVGNLNLDSLLDEIRSIGRKI
jgi:AbrB family looped-hinge helix DNA binding protein